MKNIKLLLTIAANISMFLLNAQDTLEIQRNENGKIRYAYFTSDGTRKMVDGQLFLKRTLQSKPDDDFKLIKVLSDEV